MYPPDTSYPPIKSKVILEPSQSPKITVSNITYLILLSTSEKITFPVDVTVITLNGKTEKIHSLRTQADSIIIILR